MLQADKQQMISTLSWVADGDDFVADEGACEFTAQNNGDGTWAVNRKLAIPEDPNHDSPQEFLGNFKVQVLIHLPKVVQSDERLRADLLVVAIRGGGQWDHTGTRQSDLHVLRDALTGTTYLFDSYADWRIGQVRRVSFTVEIRRDSLPHIHNPRPVKNLA